MSSSFYDVEYVISVAAMGPRDHESEHFRLHSMLCCEAMIFCKFGVVNVLLIYFQLIMDLSGYNPMVSLGALHLPPYSLSSFPFRNRTLNFMEVHSIASFAVM